MRTALRMLSLLTAGAAAGMGCSLLVNFDPEGQPCDDRGACLEGYGCVAQRCVKGADAGVSVCGFCPLGQKCLEVTRSCVPNTCLYTRCVVGTACTEDTGAPLCRAVREPALGHPCVEDTDCSKNGGSRFCLRGAIPSQAPQGGSRTGICVERCPLFGGSCLTAGATCRTFPLALDAGATQLCLPDNLLFPCRSDPECLDPSYACTVFDNANLGPVTVCDAKLQGGAAAGSACTPGRADGGSQPLCANGLCVPQDVPGGLAPACGATCDRGGCPGSQTCAQVELTVSGTPRHVAMCVDSVSFCKDCSTSSNCQPDAPRCSLLGARPVCLPACALDAGVGQSCPPGTQCQSLSGQLRCVPTSGACP